MVWQDWVLFALLLLSSLILLAGLFAPRGPAGERVTAQLVLAQGGLGLATLGWGLYRLIVLITSAMGFRILIWILAILLAIALGALLGYTLLRREPALPGQHQGLMARLARFQAPLGIAGLIVAILFLALAL